MLQNYGPAELEYFTGAPAAAVAPIVAAGITLTGTIAAIVAANKQQQRAGKQTTSQQAHELKIAEILQKGKQAAQQNILGIAALAAIPATLIIVKMIKNKNQPLKRGKK